jgi:hypothetical protein
MYGAGEFGAETVVMVSVEESSGSVEVLVTGSSYMQRHIFTSHLLP